MNLQENIHRIKQVMGISEQIIGVSDFNPMSGKPMPNYSKGAIKSISKMDPDDVTDVVSAGLDTVPGIGNLASFGIDVVHAVTYVYRFFTTSDNQKKMEYGIMGMITLITAYFPFVGNAANIAARGGLKTFIRRTPEEILFTLKKYGLYNQKLIALQKDKWTFSFGLFLHKIFKSEVEEYLIVVYDKLGGLLKKIVDTPLYRPVNDFRDKIDKIRNNKEVFINVAKYV
jgi:hypothetical protein